MAAKEAPAVKGAAKIEPNAATAFPTPVLKKLPILLNNPILINILLRIIYVLIPNKILIL